MQLTIATGKRMEGIPDAQISKELLEKIGVHPIYKRAQMTLEEEIAAFRPAIVFNLFSREIERMRMYTFSSTIDFQKENVYLWKLNVCFQERLTNRVKRWQVHIVQRETERRWKPFKQKMDELYKAMEKDFLKINPNIEDVKTAEFSEGCRFLAILVNEIDRECFYKLQERKWEWKRGEWFADELPMLIMKLSNVITRKATRDYRLTEEQQEQQDNKIMTSAKIDKLMNKISHYCWTFDINTKRVKGDENDE